MGMALGLGSCYYDNEAYLYPDLGDSQCDTTSISYDVSIQPLMQENCYSCHRASVAPSLGGNIKLDNYDLLKAAVDNGNLWGSVSHASGYEPMPKNAAQLGPCELAKIRQWIDKGALNN